MLTTLATDIKIPNGNGNIHLAQGQQVRLTGQIELPSYKQTNPNDYFVQIEWQKGHFTNVRPNVLTRSY